MKSGQLFFQSVVLMAKLQHFLMFTNIGNGVKQNFAKILLFCEGLTPGIRSQDQSKQLQAY